METVLYVVGAGTAIAQFIKVMQDLGETKLAKKASTMFKNIKEKVSSFIKKPNDKMQELQGRIDGLVTSGTDVLSNGKGGISPNVQSTIAEEILPC